MAYQDNFLRELIVDSFAGGGGASTGIELALGQPVDIAINHDPDAIAMHKINHPYTKHYCESVWDIDPMQVTGGRPVGLLWGSPDCRHFSKAKGGRPVSKKIRGLAWVLLRWAAKVRPRVIILENVEEFKTWGPIRHGRPIKSKSGQTFQKFITQLRDLGYAVEWRELRACDYGAPTSRKRFFMIARCDGAPIMWPTPTHGKGRKPYRTAADIIDRSIPCLSIFERKKPLATATMRRIARGQDKFVIKNPKPFIMQMNFENAPQNVNAPLSTITAINKHYIVNPCIVPVGYGERKGQAPRVNDSNEPLSTIVSTCKQNLVAPKLAPYITVNNNNNVPSGADEPLRTVTTGGRHLLTAPALLQYHSEQTPNETRGQGLTQPISTIDTGNRYAVTAAHLTKYFSGEQQAGAAADEPLPTVTAVDHNALVGTSLVKYYGTGENAEATTAPLSTITAKDRLGLVQSNICVLRNNMDNKPLDEPLPTVTAGGGQLAQVVTYIHKIDGAEDLGHWPEVRALLNEYCDYNIAADEILILQISGIEYFIADIGMRMLEPHELFAAQGFPPDYLIDIETVTGKRYSKAKQIARCGNSVCPPLAAALVRANFRETAARKILTTMQELQQVIEK